jgi:hypothetical protein
MTTRPGPGLLSSGWKLTVSTVLLPGFGHFGIAGTTLRPKCRSISSSPKAAILENCVTFLGSGTRGKSRLRKGLNRSRGRHPFASPASRLLDLASGFCLRAAVIRRSVVCA